jgi:predicted NBD/HSP70 family sugar kinase
VAQELGTPLTVEVLHDAAAAVLGEVSLRGTRPGCRNCVFIVWGTGVASGIVSDGRLYWRDPVVGLMTGEIGLLVIRKPDGCFEYRPSAQVPDLGASELRLDRWLRGPEIARRSVQRASEDARGRTLLNRAGRTLDELDLVDVNRAARRGDALAVELIESAGGEMGRALTPFIHYWLVERRAEFVRNIIIGSGVAKLGNGLKRDGKGVLITAIREAIDHDLRSLGVDDYDTANVILSAIGYEREFYAFIPRSPLRQRQGDWPLS